MSKIHYPTEKYKPARKKHLSELSATKLLAGIGTMANEAATSRDPRVHMAALQVLAMQVPVINRLIGDQL